MNYGVRFEHFAHEIPSETAPAGRFSAARTFGWSAEEILGKPLTTLMPDGLREQTADRLVQLKERLADILIFDRED